MDERQPGIRQATTANRLLRAMSAADFALLSPHLKPRRAAKHQVLFHHGGPIQSAWFLETGIGSLLTVAADGQRVESGLFGRDGFAPVALALGSDRTPHQGVIQVDDDCWTLAVDVLREAMERSPTLHALLLRYAQTLYVQTEFTALSNAVHSVEERLARWLLMCIDRTDGDELLLTHDYMSIMLAVRRPSVTTALHTLEGNGHIRVRRGRVIIRDRAGLEAFSAGGYGQPEREYERLIGPLR